MDPIWIAPAVQYRVNVDELILHQIVNRKRKPFCQHPMQSVGHLMDTGIYQERAHVGLQAVEKIISQAGCLTLIEKPTIAEVVSGWLKKANSHEVRP